MTLVNDGPCALNSCAVTGKSENQGLRSCKQEYKEDSRQ